MAQTRERGSEKKSAWDYVVLLGGYSRCALGDLARSLDVRPETAESWQEPENCVGILDLQLERAL